MAKIYKLTCDDPDLIYYGSTIQKLNKRLHGHTGDNKRKSNYSTKPLFEKGNVKIHLIEECSIEDRKNREAYYIQNFPCVNKVIPWFDGNGQKERNKKNANDYYYKNKELCLKKQLQEITCECGATFTKGHSYRHLKSDKHLDWLNKVPKLTKNEKQKIYYQNNKETISSKQKEKILCECGSFLVKHKLSRHLSSKKHQDYLKR